MPRRRIDEHGFHVDHRAHISFHDTDEDLVMIENEFHRLYVDNRLLRKENLDLRREIAAANEEIQILSQVIPQLRADKELEGRELIQRGLKLEAELRAFEPVKAEATKLLAEAEKGDAATQQLSAQVQTLRQQLKHFLDDNQQIKALKAEIGVLHQELMRARKAYDYERRVNADQLQQKYRIEMNLGSMAREVEKLRELEERKTTCCRNSLHDNPNLMNPSPDIGYQFLQGDGYADKKSP